MPLPAFAIRAKPAYPSTAYSKREPVTWWPEMALGILAFATTILPPAVGPALAFLLFAFPFVWWLGSGKPWPRELVGLVVPFVIMIVAGLVHGFSYPKFQIGKDAWYLGNAALMVGVGYVLATAGGRFQTIARPIVLVGLFAALLHLSRFALHPAILLKPSAAIRIYAGFGYGVASAALIMIILSKWLRLRLFGSFDWIVYPIALICVASFVLSFSRTGMFAMLIQLTILSGVINLTSPKRVLLYAALTLGLILAAATIPLPSGHGVGQQKFVAKLMRSFEEIRVDEYFLRNQIQANWRGYETARALRTYRDGRPDEWILGKGLGTPVDLGLGLNLGGAPGGELMRYAPVLHNGYLFVLVKAGVVGLVSLVFWFGYVAVLGARAAGSRSKLVSLGGRMILSSVFLLIITNWTTSSVFPKTGLAGFLILGAFLALTAKDRVEKRAEEVARTESVRTLRSHSATSPV